MQSIFSPPSGGAPGRARALLLVSLLAAAATFPLPAAELPLDLDVQPAPLAENLHARDSNGKMRFLGMLVLPNVTVNGLRLSQLSDIAWDDDTGLLYAISDKGILFHLQPVFHDGILTDLKVADAVRLREIESEKPLRNRRLDAEGLDIVHGSNGPKKDTQLIISFERYPRILRYRPDGHAIEEYKLPKVLSERKSYAQANRMLEAVCHDRRRGVLTMSEKPLENETPGYSRIYGVSGESWRYPIADKDRVVSLSCTGNGDVFVLEGNFGTRFWRSHSTLKRVRLPSSSTGDAPLQTETLFSLESSKGYQIDNFEGIAHHRGNRFFMVSDDNDFFLQRTLLLYFELLEN